jgi:carbon starvation protein
MIPMIFVLITSFLGGLIQLRAFYEAGNYLLVALDFIVLVVSVLVMLEAASVVMKLKKDQAEAQAKA